MRRSCRHQPQQGLSGLSFEEEDGSVCVMGCPAIGRAVVRDAAAAAASAAAAERRLPALLRQRNSSPFKHSLGANDKARANEIRFIATRCCDSIDKMDSSALSWAGTHHAVQ